MFNEDYKNTAMRDAELANNRYKLTLQRANDSTMRLFQSRQRALQTINRIEDYIKVLANKPRDYERKIGQIKIHYLEFSKRMDEIKRLEEKQRNASYEKKIGAGVLLGAGGAALAPTAAMAVATTFGTASTGVAISSLSGAAATNAALAWLGGGALSAGGAGIVGGQALLTLTGPVGWAIGGASAIGAAVMASSANREIGEKAESATRKIIRETERLKEIDAQVCAWNKETIKLSVELTKKLTSFRHKKDYSLFTENDKHEMIILMNMTEVLSKKLGDKIS